MSAGTDGIRGDTIVALASGRPPAAIAVIRLSGPHAAETVRALCGRLPAARRASLTTFRSPDGAVLDSGLVLFLPGPGSPTGEDVAEFHVHGGRAVVAAMLEALTARPGVRLAEPGEFTRRAFLAGRMDLAAVEGLADLVAADTDAQRRQALVQASGVLGARVSGWRQRILEARALAEASLDFADEDDVAADALEQARAAATALRHELSAALADSGGGERLREGFRVVVLGPPNAGKSSLVNALARRDVAIVTAEPGTTRDLIEVHLDLGGYPVLVTDTAGLREASGAVEAEGIRRARGRAEDADLLLWLSPADAPVSPPHDLPQAPLQFVVTKADLMVAEPEPAVGDALNGPADLPLLPAASGEKVPGGRMRVARGSAPSAEVGAATPAPLAISVHTGAGVAELVAFIAAKAAASLAGGETAVLVRARHREAAQDAVAALDRALSEGVSPELVAEDLRLASDALGRIVGAVGVEDVLGRIFSAFCIGK